MPILTQVALGGDSSTDLGACGALTAAFAHAAIYHGVAGQVLGAARTGQLELLTPVLRQLELAQATRMVTSALLRAQVSAIRRAIFHASGVEPVLIKGPAVADRFYVDPEERSFADLDFLLPRQGIAPAVQALSERLSYRQIKLPWPAGLERHGHAVELHRTLGVHTLLVELHWRVSDDPAAHALDHARVSARAHRWPGDTDVQVPDPALQLLLLAVHLLHHPQRALSWLIDIRRIVETHPDETWREAFSLADALGLGWVLHAALDDVERVTGVLRGRPSERPPPVAWGPLRIAQILPEEHIGYHAGQLATLPWRERGRYLLTGTAGVLRRARWQGRSPDRTADRR